jgi:hypothetical protein
MSFGGDGCSYKLSFTIHANEISEMDAAPDLESRSASGFNALLPTTVFDGPSPVAVPIQRAPRRSLRKCGENEGRMF